MKRLVEDLILLEFIRQKTPLNKEGPGLTGSLDNPLPILHRRQTPKAANYIDLQETM